MNNLNEFLEIPDFNNYVINRDGIVLDKVANKLIVPRIYKNGYLTYNIKRNAGNYTLIGKGRLLGLTFIKDDRNTSDLYINHINGNKLDDRLENLEWVTPQENQIHAGKIGLTEKCLPINVRYIDTGVIEYFSSFIECAKKYSLSRDAIAYRLKHGEKRVFGERKQYRLASVTTPWFIPENVELEVLKNGTSKGLLVKFLKDDRVLEFNKLTDFALYQNISASTITHWLSLPNQPVLPGCIQIKYTFDPSPWRKVEDPYMELNDFGCNRVIKVINSKTKEEIIFPSAKECAQKMGIKETTLSYRLKSNGKTFFSDGFSYEYYKK